MEDQIIQRVPPPNNKENGEHISMFREKFETAVNVWTVSAPVLRWENALRFKYQSI